MKNLHGVLLRIVPPGRLKVTSLLCLIATVVLALIVAHGRSPYAVEQPLLDWLGRPSAIHAWAKLAELLAAPAIGAALVVSVAFGFIRGAFLRVAVYAAFAAATLLISEHVAKPLVQRTYEAELTFPSGNVTAVCASALAMWLALYPLLGKGAREITFLLGAAWVLLMSLAVVGAQWHTPLDDVGSILLSVGIVTGGAAFFEPVANRRPFARAERARFSRRE